jgi:MFS family permease
VFGYNNGVIPGVLVLPAFYEDFQLPPVGSSSYNTITSNIVALVQIGGLAGSVGTFPLMKFWGRKIALSVAAGVFTIGAALQVCLSSLNKRNTYSYLDICIWET